MDSTISEIKNTDKIVNDNFFNKKNFKILLSETIGTFLLVAGILLPGAIGVNLDPEVHAGLMNSKTGVMTVF